MSVSDHAHLLEAGTANIEDYPPEDFPTRPSASTTPGTRTGSQYALTRYEVTKSFANRLIYSRAYILFYLAMAALSVTTVVLSLVEGCPGLAFYVLEIIVNTAMIIEVGIRMVALSRQFWKSVFNWIDLVVTLFCVVTLLVVVFTPCANKGEEVLDTLVLVARNILQFGRLAALMRKSGTSIFAQPKPIDLSRPSRADIDMSDDEDESELSRPLVGDRVLFDATRPQPQRPPPGPPVPVDQEDLWASMG